MSSERGDRQNRRGGGLRTCVGTGLRLPPEQLERFAFIEGAGLIFDLRHKAPGRGVWLQVSEESLRNAHARGFARSLKRRLDLPPLEEIVRVMREGIALRAMEYVQAAVRSGQVAIGGQAVSDAMRRDAVSLLLMAHDASDGSKQKYLRNAERKGIPHDALRYSGQELGGVTKRDFVAHLAILSEGLAENLQRDLGHLTTLEEIEA